MRVGIYAPRPLGGRATGVARYTQCLLAGLARAGGARDYRIYGDAGSSGLPQDPLPAGTLNRLWQEHRGLAVRAERDGLDLLHSPRSALPWGLRVPAVVTVFDLLSWRMPEQYPRAWLWYWQPRIRHAARRARRVAAISEFTARDVERFLGVEPSRIDVVPCGVDPSFRPPAPERVAAMRAHLGLEAPYALYVGNFFSRKNLVRLVEAWAGLADPPCLALAGPGGEGEAEIRTAVARARLEGRVRFLGYTAEGELPALYAGAELVAYPSLAEGFGLPVLEAMACGAPVLTSAGTAMAEVAGPAAVLVEPGSVDDIRAGLRRLLDDPALRERLRLQGPVLASRYGWDEVARRMVETYDRAAGRAP